MSETSFVFTTSIVKEQHFTIPLDEYMVDPDVTCVIFEFSLPSGSTKTLRIPSHLFDPQWK